eukprot:5827843-Prymnesium_polylepis.1
MRERGGEAVEQGVAKALQSVARGTSQRQAAADEGVPFSTLNKAWNAMEGASNGTAWQAFVAALPPVLPPSAAAPAAPAAAVVESPLGPRLRRNASRHGDAVPYGHHGEWGMYREGTKEMSTKIQEGKLTPEEAKDQLAAEGVYIGAESLRMKAKHAPGKSPVKAGQKQKLDWDLQEQVHTEIAMLRKYDLPVTKSLVKCMVLSKLTDEQQQELFPKGMTNRVYYTFLDNFDMNTEETKPLESDRDLWLTSKVPMPNRSHARSRRHVPAPAFNRALLSLAER